MKLVQINSVNYGSTGKIMNGIADVAKTQGIESYTFCAKSRTNLLKCYENQFYIGSILSRNLHLFLSKITGYNGCFSILDTYFFLKKLDKINPDVIHLHNLHNSYINLPMLFRYIKKHNIKTVWTLHDCWAFTGQCPHFQLSKCTKWVDGCYACNHFREYPSSIVDRTKSMYRLKKKWFTGVDNMIIVTPSDWLADLVKKSFLSEYNVKVINNGIDLSAFSPTPSNIREKLDLKTKKVLLGCALPWSNRKGLDVFFKLAKMLDNNYEIILVGLNAEQIRSTPKNIIGIEKTFDRTELAQYYTLADVFVNPTKEEVLGLVNIEALACGTPVITFDSGGSPECVDENSGIVVTRNDIVAMKNAIIKVVESGCIKREDCIKRARNFDNTKKFREYIDLY